MRILENELKNKSINYDKLLKYGFIRQDGVYLYKTEICDGQFEVRVTAENGKMTSKLFDLLYWDEYILADIQDSSGKFVGKVREAYENELNNIIEKCTVPDVFKSKQAREVIRYIKDSYNDDLEYLWEKFPDNAVWRNKKNKKWYGILLIISERKLKIESDKRIEIIDLRYSKDRIKEIVDNKKIFAGYHMNKNNWITIKLDGSVKTETIFELIDESYNLSLKK